MPGTRANTKAYVDVSFTVTQDGAVRDPSVIATVLCEELFYREDYDEVSIEKLQSEFQKAAIKAVLKFKYKPRIIDGEAVDVPGVKTRISFQLEDDPEEGADTSSKPEEPVDPGK